LKKNNLNKDWKKFGRNRKKDRLIAQKLRLDPETYELFENWRKSRYLSQEKAINEIFKYIIKENKGILEKNESI